MKLLNNGRCKLFPAAREVQTLSSSMVHLFVGLAGGGVDNALVKVHATLR